MSSVELDARPVVGVLHPGAMGAALGAALRPVAGQVIWAAADRSQETSKRAELADLVAVPDLADLVLRSQVIISICPPDVALAVAQQVAAAARRYERSPLFVDSNAVSPATMRAVAALLGADRVVDGGVIGPPAWQPGTTVLWLSGPAAGTVAALFDGSAFDARVLGSEIGQASGLKACFALQSKALPAIWLEAAEAAKAYGVLDALRGELTRNGVDLDDRVAAVQKRAGPKAWRWAGEMDEAAEAFAELGLSDGFSRAAADIYRRMPPARPGGPRAT